MKTRLLFHILLFAQVAIQAAEPPKLVPRPIPGMAAPTPATAAAAPTTFSSTQPTAPILSPKPDVARILYIHRRATLPSELTKNLPAPQADSTVSATMLNVRQSAVKIIPKSEVLQITTSKP